MKTKLLKQTRHDDRTSAQEAAERYYAEHPKSPAAMQQPRILVRGGRYVALLGSSISGGVFGFGSTVASALRSFDDLYAISRRSRQPLARSASRKGNF
jgi:hypothetical protein